MGIRRYQLPGGTPANAGNQNWQGPSAAGRSVTDAFLLEPPAAPDSWDLVAANMTDPALEANGWTAKLNGAPYTVLTRVGDVQPGNALPGPGTYWSTLIAGRLLVKWPSGQSVEIVRATAGSWVYKSHVSPANWDANLGVLAFVAAGNDFFQPGNVIAYAGREGGNSVKGIIHIGPATFNTIFNAADGASDLNVDRVSYLTDTGSGARGIGVSFRYPNGVYWRAALSDLGPVSFTTTSAGVLLFSDNGSGPNYFYVDFIRRLPPGSVL